MVRSELIETIAMKANISRTKAQEVVTMAFEEIVAALTTEGRVEIRGFGSIAVRKYRAYDGLNPKTGEPITVPAKKLPFWKTGTELRMRVDSIDLTRGG